MKQICTLVVCWYLPKLRNDKVGCWEGPLMAVQLRAGGAQCGDQEREEVLARRAWVMGGQGSWGRWMGRRSPEGKWGSLVTGRKRQEA